MGGGGVIEITTSDFFALDQTKKSPKLLKKSQIAKESWLCDCNQFIAKESYIFDLPFRLSTYTLGQKPFWRSIFQTHPFPRDISSIIMLYWNICWVNTLLIIRWTKMRMLLKKDFTPLWTRICNADIFFSSYFERLALISTYLSKLTT